MGAYNLLSRRIGSALAERMILSGRTYSAAELYDMGIVDILAEDGQGVQATENYMKSHNQSHNTIRSIKKIRQIVHPITRQELVDIVDIWIDASMKLSEKDLDKYILPHPLLGRMPLREMLFFTIYHTQHHTNSIKELYGEQ